MLCAMRPVMRRIVLALAAFVVAAGVLEVTARVAGLSGRAAVLSPLACAALLGLMVFFVADGAG